MTDRGSAEIEALLAAAAVDPIAAPAFLEALLASTVIVPGTASGDGTARLADLLGADGRSVQPFYTSEARLTETLEVVPSFERRFLALPCRVLWQMTRGATLVLNPHSAHGKNFLPGEIGQLLDGAATLTPRMVQAETQVLVGEPARVPPGMKEALVAFLERHPEVDEAVLGWKVTPEGAGSVDESYLLVLVGAPGLRESLGGDLAQTLVVYSQSAPIDVMYVAPGADHLLRSVKPFHRRRRGLFGRR
ncbi:enhanced serine sensitivity protein SseB C-terminal domain-containing protein [Herbiconiux sp. CPCC 203407]|uniref:Enhanced serine sensitivity protein SseB C-terminal domain-containing protein n=1 Tax=Herbiconiux oxytropis TaxID=2970915 RepID=A0AA41XKE4_9MICO|nr:enhanced serine sensitivity protein SseB C-terminal domain-containing protein [Herbiconiux oxytropis]MCS5721773.1 enhanced serine sensitivity protein SseB C-terminal domain-containing protein [Herbiconiux oxytropis]MCS5727998.1 enhanced serine sensitivity protein SseB C-terminal domain-containing protein [Herbiconiux oxytropis]